jgi:hypothetical protein
VRLTGVSLPVKVVLGVAVALQIQAGLLAGWTVSEWDMVVSNVIEEVDFFLLEEKTCGNGMDWSIAPTLIEETSILVELLEVVSVGLGSKPIQIANFEVGPLILVSYDSTWN